MKCPKCSSQFEQVTFQGITVDRCTNCRGLWFDMLEKDDLEKMEGSESIDIGDTEIGQWQNHVQKIECPKCHVKMIKMIDKEQHHIKYELCPTCYGTYFDAGEFRDLKEHSILEHFKELLDTIRSNLK